MSRRAAAWLAWFLWALCVVFAVLAVSLALYTPPFPEGAPTWGVVLAVSFLAYPTVGAFVASRRPKNLRRLDIVLGGPTVREPGFRDSVCWLLYIRPS